LRRNHELSIIPTNQSSRQQGGCNAPAHFSRLISVHASSASRADRAKGAVIVSFIHSIFVVHEETQEYFGQTEVGFNAVFFSLNQVRILVGSEEINGRSAQQQGQDQTQRCREK